LRVINCSSFVSEHFESLFHVDVDGVLYAQCKQPKRERKHRFRGRCIVHFRPRFLLRRSY
jgi:hypothetical protein